ncbi:hypothetical protein ABID59_004469 [Bradyrhizobium sp. S3.3.6]
MTIVESAKGACNAMKPKSTTTSKIGAGAGFRPQCRILDRFAYLLSVALLLCCSGTFDAEDLPNAAADVFYDQTDGKMLSPHS